MNIEEAIKVINDMIKTENNYINDKKYLMQHNIEKGAVEYAEKWIKAVETLLTAYEKEKGENVKLRLQDIPLIEGELKAYKNRVNELKAELEKEKEKNKELNALRLKEINNTKYWIHKDKIKAKIEYNKTFNDDIHKYTTLTLEELLEKE